VEWGSGYPVSMKGTIAIADARKELILRMLRTNREPLSPIFSRTIGHGHSTSRINGIFAQRARSLMKCIGRTGTWMVVASLMIGGGFAAQPVHARQAVIADTLPPQSATASAEKWSSDLWQAAIGGDKKAIETAFRNVPENALDQAMVTRFRESLTLLNTNNSNALLKRDEAREKAMAELREFVAKDDLPKALRAAVTVQTLSDSFETAFDDADIAKVIAWGKTAVPKAEAEDDWLTAQELLYYLRTLHEDTSKTAEHRQFKLDFEAVNRRVALLAQYAPKRLHELRVKRAERMGDKPLGEYKPGSQADWNEHIDGIRADILKAVLKKAAADHIEAKGFRPLLLGGLEELRLLSTTKSLDETFPKLADPAAVKGWTDFIDEQTAIINATANDKELTSWTLTDLIDSLLVQNDRTIQIPEGVLFREFGDGATFRLDEFSEIIWPDKLARFKQNVEGAFVGVGILIRHDDSQQIMVVNPLEGTPAYFAGVKPNDIIAEVDGESTVGWSLNDAVDRITGLPKTKVTLGIQREGVEGLMPIGLERNRIKLRSVLGWYKQNLDAEGTPQWDWYLDPTSRVAYMRLSQFTEDTYTDILTAWDEINKTSKPTGLILDLRYNPGGLLTSAVAVSNLWVDQGVIVTGEDKDGRRAWPDQKAKSNTAKLAGVPTVVLINQGSASASEIVAGCLQAHGAAVIMGERSFGKGSVQTVPPIGPNAWLKLTTQYYRLPAAPGQEKGRLVHKRLGATEWGVDPDVLVKMTPQQVKDSLELRQEADVIPQDDKGQVEPNSTKRPDVNRLITEGMDSQLETALLLLQSQAMASSASGVKQASRE